METVLPCIIPSRNISNSITKKRHQLQQNRKISHFIDKFSLYNNLKIGKKVGSLVHQYKYMVGTEWVKGWLWDPLAHLQFLSPLIFFFFCWIFEIFALFSKGSWLSNVCVQYISCKFICLANYLSILNKHDAHIWKNTTNRESPTQIKYCKQLWPQIFEKGALFLENEWFWHPKWDTCVTHMGINKIKQKQKILP